VGVAFWGSRDGGCGCGCGTFVGVFGAADEDLMGWDGMGSRVRDRGSGDDCRE
jgi:hypothetical protein